MAEQLFRKMLKDAGRSNVEVSSGGTAPSPWIPFPSEAKEALKQVGVDAAAHHAKPVTKEAAERADWILVMEEHHRQALAKQFPDAQRKIRLLNEAAALGSKGIDDPFGRPLVAYQTALAEIQRALQSLVAQLPA
jgi:protein-tyrosine phosphatase